MRHRPRSKRSGSRRGWRAERGGCGVTTSGPLAKARQLIALAASDSKEEARTAAFQACRLIREHGFEVVEKRGESSFAGPSVWDVVYGSPYAGVNRNGAPRWYEAPGQSNAARNTQAWVEELFRRDRAERAAAPNPKKRGSIIVTHRRHRCQECNERVEWLAFFADDGNWYHPECVERTGCA